MKNQSLISTLCDDTEGLKQELRTKEGVVMFPYQIPTFFKWCVGASQKGKEGKKKERERSDGREKTGEGRKIPIQPMEKVQNERKLTETEQELYTFNSEGVFYACDLIFVIGWKFEKYLREACKFSLSVFL